jgi:hypothetical protein
MECTQGDVIEDAVTGEIDSKEEYEANDVVINAQSDSGAKDQNDSNKQGDKSPTKKPIVILSQEEIKEKLENHIEDIESRIENRLKISKRMILRELDSKIMDSLTKAIKQYRNNGWSSPSSKKRAKNNSLKKLPPLSSNHSMNMTSQKSWSKSQKYKTHQNPKSGIFQHSSPYLKPGSASDKRPSSVHSKKQD